MPVGVSLIPKHLSGSTRPVLVLEIGILEKVWFCKIDENGKRYNHIIDTKTGYPSRTNILSVSVIAKSCMTADAYATALQTMPLDKLEIFLNSNPTLKVFVIYQGDNEDLEFKTFNEFSFY